MPLHWFNSANPNPNKYEEVSDSKPLPVTVLSSASTGGAVDISSPAPGALSAGDNAITFASPVNHILIQNNTANDLNYELDAAASPGTFLLAQGQLAQIDAPCAVLHLYVSGTPALNGAVAGNIVVRGYS